MQGPECHLLVAVVSFCHNCGIRPLLTQPVRRSRPFGQTTHNTDPHVAFERRSFKVTEVLESDAPPVGRTCIHVVEMGRHRNSRFTRTGPGSCLLFAEPQPTRPCRCPTDRGRQRTVFRGTAWASRESPSQPPRRPVN